MAAGGVDGFLDEAHFVVDSWGIVEDGWRMI